MKQSESIKALSAALCKAHAEFENAVKNAVNPHFKNRYADLEHVLEAIRPVLAAHQLAIVQLPASVEGNSVSLVTRVLHTSGEWLEETASSPIERQNPQGVGSAISYLRRYSLAAVCGITQADDDGEAASVNSQPERTQTTPLPPMQRGSDLPPPPPKSPPQARRTAAAQPPARPDAYKTKPGELVCETQIEDVSIIKNGQGKNGPWQLAKVVGANGKQWTTLNDEWIARAQQARETAEPQTVRWVEKPSKNGQYTDLDIVSLESALPT